MLGHGPVAVGQHAMEEVAEGCIRRVGEQRLVRVRVRGAFRVRVELEVA